MSSLVRLIVLGFAATLAVGCGTPSLLITPIANTNDLDETTVQRGEGWFPDKIAIIEVEGMLMNARAGGFFQATENPVSKFAQQLEQAERDPDVKAVVLRVNCPGGTVTSSDTMYQMVRRFREKTGKPVIVSAQEIMASGGYYIACAADEIVVQPTSVVGSIGVIFETMQFKGTMDKLGITTSSIKSGWLKDMGSPFKLLRDDEKKVMQGMVDEYFGRFVAVVRSERQIAEAPAKDFAEYNQAGYDGVFSGRVWSGESAVKLGLADRTGLLSDAIDVARTRCKSPGAKVIMYRRPYAYGGSIYASSPTQPPDANVLRLELPQTGALLPDGFYYLWRP